MNTSDEKIEAGDFVLVKDERALIRRLQEDHGGWVDAMAGVRTATVRVK